MAVNNYHNIKIGIDIGTSKVVCLIAESSSDGINVIGLGSHPSRGLRDGVVVDIEATVNAIRKATERAEMMSGIAVNKAYVGISGGSSCGPIQKEQFRLEIEKLKLVMWIK